MRIAIIGGTGFIGRRIVERLVERGDDVLVVHRGQTEPADLRESRHLHVDRKDFAAVAGEVAAWAPDAVIDTMALASADMEAVLPHLPDVPVVVLSSMDVYRCYAGVMDDDDSPIAVPIDEDGEVRLNRYPYRGRVLPHDDGDLENYEKLDVEPAYLARGGTVLRLAMVFGPRDPQRREDIVLRRVRAGRSRIPVGAGTTVFTMVDVNDVASAVLAVLDRPEVAAGQIFNIGETGSYRVRAWLRLILDAAGSDAVLVTVPDEALPDDLRLTRAHSQHLLATSVKAERLLGWRATPTAETVARSVRWHLDHPQPEAGGWAADDAALAIAEPDVALVLAAYAAFGRGDIDSAVSGLHPDVEWIEPDEFPNGGVRHGPEEVAAYLRASHESWRERQSEVTAHRRGDRILIVHHLTGVLADGIPHEVTVADLFTVRDGLVVHMIAYADPTEAFAAHPA